MKKKQNEQDMKKTMNVILGLALLFLTVILAVNGVRKIQEAAVFSAVIAICGVVLFGSVGVMLLVGEVRQWLRLKK